MITEAIKWRQARMEYFAKQRKTEPSDLIPLANAEHELMEAILNYQMGG